MGYVYKGYIMVANNMNKSYALRSITVTVEHTCNNGTTAPLNQVNIDKYSVSPCNSFLSQKGEDDHWKVTVVARNKTYVGEFKANYEDIDSEGAIMVSIHEITQTHNYIIFNMMFPNSSNVCEQIPLVAEVPESE